MKITDFGSVRDIVDADLTAKVGTYTYMAPEVFNGTKYTTKCDIFSFGITVCEMFTRHKPYASENRLALPKFFDKVGKTDAPLRPTMTRDVPGTLYTLIKR